MAHDGTSIERRLRPPSQAREVGIFAFWRRSVSLDGFPLCTPLFFVTLFLLTRFLTVPLSGGGFAC